MTANISAPGPTNCTRTSDWLRYRPSPPPACAAGPSSAAPPGPVSPAASFGSSASPRERSVTEAGCARSESPECGPRARKSSPESPSGKVNAKSVQTYDLRVNFSSSPLHIAPPPAW